MAAHGGSGNKGIGLEAILLAILALGIMAWLLVAIGRASEPLRTTLPLMWRKAPQFLGANWDRTHLLEPLQKDKKLEDMTRAEVRSLLGTPGYSAVLYPGAESYDEYRLSARNDHVLRIVYRLDGTVESKGIDAGACACLQCDAAKSSFPRWLLQNRRLLSKEPTQSEFTVARFEKMLGSQGQRSVSRDVVGEQAWLNYSDTWRLFGEPNGFFMADGQVPVTSDATEQIDDEPVDSWALITYQRDCLPR
jgi:hypothetical protein